MENKSGYVRLAMAVLQQEERQIWETGGGITLASLLNAYLANLTCWKGPGGKEEPRRRWALQHVYGLPIENQRAQKLKSTSINAQGVLGLKELRENPECVKQLSRFLVSTPDEMEEIRTKLEEKIQENQRVLLACAEETRRRTLVEQELEKLRQERENLFQRYEELEQAMKVLQSSTKEFQEAVAQPNKMFGGRLGRICWFLLHKRVKRAPL